MSVGEIVGLGKGVGGEVAVGVHANATMAREATIRSNAGIKAVNLTIISV